MNKDNSIRVRYGHFEQTKRIYEMQMHGMPPEDVEEYQQNRILKDGTDWEENGSFMSTPGQCLSAA